jgi:predicted permease
MLNDIRYALRTFARSPSFAVTAIGTLALGISVNTIAFSLLNSLVLRPMPVRDAARVVRVYPVDASGRRGNLFSYPDYEDLRQAVPLFDTLAAYVPADLTAGRSSLDRAVAPPRPALGYVVSAAYFDLTGVRPALGRVLQPDDDRAGSRAAVLGYSFWQSRFAADPAAIGAAIALNGESFTIVGVAAPEFHGTEPLVADVWLPVSALPIAVPDARALFDRSDAGFLVAGRLSPGISRAQAVDALGTVARRLAATHSGPSRPARVEVTPGTFFTPDDSGIKPVIAGIMAVVGLVLVIACANVANLILARAASRQREIAVRLAIGAARSRIVRQLTVESLMLSVTAGGVALLLATWALRVLYTLGVSLVPFPFTVALSLDPDIRVFAYTLGLAVAGGVALGLVPALQASSPHIVRGLHDQGAIAGARIRGSRLRNGLVVMQIAGSLVLLLAAGLLVRGLQSARALDLGFTARGVVYAEYDLRSAGYTRARAEAFNAALVARAAALPGATSVALTSHVPLHGGVRRVTVRLLDAPTIAPVTTIASTVSRAYFETLGIDIVAGRNFGPDAAGSTSAIVISEGLARRFWPGQSALGKVVAADGWSGPRTVIGLARDASNGAIWRDKEMSIYLPVAPDTDARDLTIVARLSGDVASGARTMEAFAAALDQNLRFDAAPLDVLLRLWLLPSRVAAGAAGVLAALAILLAGIGLYGVLSFSVSHRRREIGVRMALGADARSVVKLVLRDSARLVATGLVTGGAVALVAAPLLGRLLFDVSAFDPVTLIVVPILLTAVAGAASYVPARRAARLEPLAVLRAE